MTPDPVFLILIAGLVLFCILLFGIPIWLVRYHPHLDDKDVELINTMVVSFLALLVVSNALVKLLLLLWDRTGSPAQAIFWIGTGICAVLVSTGIIILYTRLTGIRMNPGLGALAGAFFTGLWFITSSLLLSFVILYAGFILLLLLLIYQKKTGISLNFDSARSMETFRLLSVIFLIAIVAGPLLFLMITNSVPFALLVLCLLAFFSYGRLFPLITTMTEDEVTDLQEEDPCLNLPYEMAFGVCEKAVGLFKNPDWTEIIMSDRKSGTISFQVYTVTSLLTTCATTVTMELERTEPSRTRVKISGITSDPVICLPRRPSGMNREYVDRLVTDIRKMARGE